MRSADELGPATARERIQELDVLRGFALFGILLVNMAFFSSPLYLVVTGEQWWTDWSDRGRCNPFGQNRRTPQGI